MRASVLCTFVALCLPYSVACSDNSGGSTGAGGDNGDTDGGSSSTTGGRSGSGGTAGSGGGSGGTAGGGGGSGGTAGGGGGSGGTAGGGGGSTDPATGFVIRTPSSHSLTCANAYTGESTTETFTDVDWICSFSYDGTNGTVYVQSTPTACTVVMSATPTFTTATAQILVNGTISDVTNALYDWGGNHHNDSLSFDYGGNSYNYYHSSFGYGWRSCQNMDCLQVSVGSTGSVTDDGCTSDRTLPIVCSQIQSDGSYDSLTVDNFAKCIGDSSS